MAGGATLFNKRGNMCRQLGWMGFLLGRFGMLWGVKWVLSRTGDLLFFLVSMLMETQFLVIFRISRMVITKSLSYVVSSPVFFSADCYSDA